MLGAWKVFLPVSLLLFTVGAGMGRAFDLLMWLFCALLFAAVVALALILAGMNKSPREFLTLGVMVFICMAIYLLLAPAAFSLRTELDRRRAEKFIGMAQVEAERACPSVAPVELQVKGFSRGRAHFVYADCGPPIRLAFQFGPGFLDNWSALIYDPSDAVRGIPDAGHTVVQALPHELRALFGGKIVACKPLRDHLYDCYFT